MTTAALSDVLDVVPLGFPVHGLVHVVPGLATLAHCVHPRREPDPDSRE